MNFACCFSSGSKKSIPTSTSTSTSTSPTSLLAPKYEVQHSEPVYTHKYKTNPFSTLFTDNVITEGSNTICNPGKERVAELMMDHIQISDTNIQTFALRHTATLRKGVKENIVELVNQWRDNPDFSYKEAATAIKGILGEGIEDQDVIFMLRMFCITKPDASNFSTNYWSLVDYLLW